MKHFLEWQIYTIFMSVKTSVSHFFKIKKHVKEHLSLESLVSLE